MKTPPLPNMIIGGVVKAGTTSVFTYLSQHPEVCSSSVKEAQYFSGYRYGKSIAPIDEYRKLFSRWEGEKWLLEATPGYFEGGGVVARAIRQTLGKETKILIILREPLDRLLSFFKYKKSVLQLSRDMKLEEYIAQCERMPHEERIKQENDAFWGIDGGYYSNYLPGWLEVFGDGVKVMFFDDLKEDRIGFMTELCSWLEIDPSIYGNLDLKVENKSRNFRNKRLHSLALSVNEKMETYSRRWPALKHTLRNVYFLINRDSFDESYPQVTLEYIRSIYRPYNLKLAEILQSQYRGALPTWLSETP